MLARVLHADFSSNSRNNVDFCWSLLKIFHAKSQWSFICIPIQLTIPNSWTNPFNQRTTKIQGTMGSAGGSETFQSAFATVAGIAAAVAAGACFNGKDAEADQNSHVLLDKRRFPFHKLGKSHLVDKLANLGWLSNSEAIVHRRSPNLVALDSVGTVSKNNSSTMIQYGRPTTWQQHLEMFQLQTLHIYIYNIKYKQLYIYIYVSFLKPELL